MVITIVKGENWDTELHYLFELMDRYYLGIAFLLPIAAAFTGASFHHSHRTLCALISLGAGTLFGVTVFGILPEGTEALGVWGVLSAAGSGYLLFSLISRYVYHVCPACAASHFEEALTRRMNEVAIMMAVALSVHCAMDGLALVAGGEAAGVTRPLALPIVLAVSVHKIPEGLALGALLLGAGLKRAQAVLSVAAVEAATPLAGIIGVIFFPNISAAWIDAMVAHIGGGFLFLAIHALLGELVKLHKTLVLLNFAIGVAAIGAATFLVE